MTTSSERRLHPLSIVFGAGPQLLRVSLPLVLLALASSRGRDDVLFLASWIGGFGALFITIALLRWLRFTYRYDERDLVIRSGIFTRTERRIPYARIQNLDASQNLLQRLTGVVAVFVQTGGGEEPEASLRVLPLAALDEMRVRVIAAGGSTGDAVLTDGRTEVTAMTPDIDAPATTRPRHDATHTLLALSPRELVTAGFIENRGMVLIAGILALLQQAGLSDRLVERLITSDSAIIAATIGRWNVTDVPVVRGAMLLIAAVLTILLFIRLLSTVWAIVRLYDFRLERTGDDLHTTYGLFTRVSATIPLRRVQTVIVREGMLHRALGRCSVRVETAGGTMGTTGAPQREAIAPILRNDQLPFLLDVLQPGLSLHDAAWRPVHHRAFGRVLRGAMFWPLALSAASWFFIGEWSLAVLAGLMLLGFVYARRRTRNLAWSLTDHAVFVRDGAFTRTIRVARFNRVQVAALVRNPLDLRTGMARVRADTAGARGSLMIPFLGSDVAEQVHRELVARTANTAFTW